MEGHIYHILPGGKRGVVFFLGASYSLTASSLHFLFGNCLFKGSGIFAEYFWNTDFMSSNGRVKRT